MLFLYKTLSLILALPIDIYLFLRIIYGKEHKSRFKERLAFATIKRPDGELIWVHGASIGECNSAIPFILKLQELFPSKNILFTSGTINSAIELEKILPKNIIHQFLPLDKILTTKKFLNYWNPSEAIFFESEIWPNLITESKKRGCKLSLINARISDKSFGKWIFFHKIGFNIIKNFDIIIAQSIRDKIKFERLSGKKVEFFGNLKEHLKEIKINEKDFNKIKEETRKRNIFLASSTHKGEEEIIINLYKNLKNNIPNLLFIIAPRHPKRLDEILSLLDGINYSIRSKNEKITKETEIYIADTIGELDLFYKISDISLICGSLIDNIGGHNPYEAIRHDKIIISGQFVSNFVEIYNNLSKKKLCIMIKDSKDLKGNILKLVNDKKYRENLLKGIASYNKKSKNVLELVFLKFTKKQ